MAKVTLGGKEGAALAAQGQSTTTVIEDKRPKRQAAPPLEMKAGDGVSPPIVEGPGEKDANRGENSELRSQTNRATSEPKGNEAGAETAQPVGEAHEGLDPEDADLPERVRKRIGKKHYELVKAREEAADSERFSEQLFNERELERKKSAGLEAELAALRAKNAPAPVEAKEPHPDDPKYKNDKGEFDWLKFSRETAAYAAEKAIQAERKAQADERARLQKEEADKQFAKRLSDATKKYPDWLDVVQKSPVQLHNDGLRFIAKSEYGTDIAYHLAKHPDVAKAINDLGDPDLIIAAMGELQTTFKKPANVTPTEVAASKTVERQGAPAPITPIAASGSNPPPVDPAKMDFKQLRAYERERAKSRHR